MTINENRNLITSNIIDSSLENFGLSVNKTMTIPSRAGKTPRPIWIVSGNIFGIENIFREIQGRKFRGQWYFYNDPACDLLEHLKNNERISISRQIDNQIERKLEKASQYKSYAKNAKSKAEKIAQK